MIVIINTKALGIRIAHYRNEQGMSQKAFAIQIGVSQTTLSNLEKGKVETISIKKLEKIANLLNVTFDQLLVDSLDKFNNIPFSPAPRSIYFLKLQELMQHLTENQKLIVSKFFQYKLKKIEHKNG